MLTDIYPLRRKYLLYGEKICWRVKQYLKKKRQQRAITQNYMNGRVIILVHSSSMRSV